jgi:DNA polymerase-3 subunit delta
VKAARGQIERALKSPAEWRFFLLYGPDDAGSRALAKLVARAVGADAERVELAGSELKTDPARLADEAASNSLFGGPRYIVVEPAGDESVPAVESLLQGPAGGNPVVLVAGALKPTSKLLKLAPRPSRRYWPMPATSPKARMPSASSTSLPALKG